MEKQRKEAVEMLEAVWRRLQGDVSGKCFGGSRASPEAALKIIFSLKLFQATVFLGVCLWNMCMPLTTWWRQKAPVKAGQGDIRTQCGSHETETTAWSCVCSHWLSYVAMGHCTSRDCLQLNLQMHVLKTRLPLFPSMHLPGQFRRCSRKIMSCSYNHILQRISQRMGLSGGKHISSDWQESVFL